ncbi:MAG: hypothetical protein R3E12_01705 [Candidatus Eisenbacteria bacterium]
MTLAEYEAASFWTRLGFRKLYRNPIVMFGLAPFYMFFIHNRFAIRATAGGASSPCSRRTSCFSECS